MVCSEQQDEPASVVIVGAGIVGLVLALALEKHVGLKSELYDKVSGFHPDVGAGMGMYPNGLRVIRDISPTLLQEIRDNGYPYVYRRWERHDGTEVAVAQENVLAEEEELQSLGIRRWKLQKVLYNAVLEKGKTINFGKKLQTIETNDNGTMQLTFQDDTKRSTQLLFGADGCKSKVRSLMNHCDSRLEYTGVTCVMGMADSNPSIRGICFPSALPSKCHGCFFPTSTQEQCFQMHFPIDADSDPGNWGTLSQTVGKEECRKLSERLINDGWNERYIEPLQQVTHAVRIGFCSLNPPLERWVKDRIILLGDAAHPPVPYTGQGAQMGLEDCGTIALLLKEFCLDKRGTGLLDLTNLEEATKIYQETRIPRTFEVNEISLSWGATQQKRAERLKYNLVKEEMIRRQVFFHETLPLIIPGAAFNYREAIDTFLEKEPTHLTVVEEEKASCLDEE